jgi:hypothetical protein
MEACKLRRCGGVIKIDQTERQNKTKTVNEKCSLDKNVRCTVRSETITQKQLDEFSEQKRGYHDTSSTQTRSIMTPVGLCTNKGCDGRKAVK